MPRGVLVLLALAVFPLRLTAQVATPSGVVARPGELVRLRTAQWEYTGTLLRVVNDTAHVRFTTDSALVPRADVRRTSVQRGTRRSVPRIVALSIGGALVAGAAGGALGVALECAADCSGYFGGLGGFLVGSTIGLVAGGVGGGVYGARKRYPRWVEASLPPAAP